jgi:hypothetical protein
MFFAFQKTYSFQYYYILCCHFRMVFSLAWLVYGHFYSLFYEHCAVCHITPVCAVYSYDSFDFALFHFYFYKNDKLFHNKRFFYLNGNCSCTFGNKSFVGA